MRTRRRTSGFMKRLRVTAFGPIQEADVKFGDLTVLVGPQASGKSLFVQLYKLIEDAPAIVADISSLDPRDDDEDIPGWGSLSGFRAVSRGLLVTRARGERQQKAHGRQRNVSRCHCDLSTAAIA